MGPMFDVLIHMYIYLHKEVLQYYYHMFHEHPRSRAYAFAQYSNRRTLCIVVNSHQR